MVRIGDLMGIKAKSAIVQGDQAVAGVMGNRVHMVMAKTINIGNYESVRVEYGESVVIQDGESFDAVKQRTIGRVMATVSELADQVAQAMTA